MAIYVGLDKITLLYEIEDGFYWMAMNLARVWINHQRFYTCM